MTSRSAATNPGHRTFLVPTRGRKKSKVIATREKNVPLKIINFGNVMNELFKKRGKAIHRDHMRREEISLQARVQQQAARVISKTPGNSALVVDTHMFVKTTEGIW